MVSGGDQAYLSAPLDLFPFVDPCPPKSLYAYAPVYHISDARGEWVLKRTGNAHSSAPAIADWLASLKHAGVAVVAPAGCFSPNPRLALDGTWWVVYPFIGGTPYVASRDQIADIGRLLARIHAAPAPERPLCKVDRPPTRDGEWLRRHGDAAARLMSEAGYDAMPFRKALAGRALAAIAVPTLPLVAGCFDFKASNLVFTPAPVLVDPDHAACLPRLLDLAVAVLLFHNDAPHAPHRMWDSDEWRVFVESYRMLIDLTPEELAAWPSVLRATWLDQGVWLLANFPEGWGDRAEARYLADLAVADLARFTLC